MAEGKKKKVTYAEPSDYIPKAIRKKYGLGEYDTSEGEKKTVTKKPKKK